MAEDTVVRTPGPWPGTEISVLESPSGDGPEARTFWLRLPDGFWIAAHHHPSDKRVNVISGTLLLGFGDVEDPTDTWELPAGSFTVVPAGSVHYEGTRGETIVQFSAVGPWGTVLAHPERPAFWRETPDPALAGSCERDPDFGKLDFWLGEWQVSVQGRGMGVNRIVKILGGCAVMEFWDRAGGGHGRSLFYHHPVTGRWKQVWITDDAPSVGGVKEKELVAELEDGSLRFQGEVLLSGGGSYLDRTTLTPLPDGRVRQLIEISRDRGESWESTFDALYRRRGR
jgi:quercetin dioxygenase-like cupin family protein